MHRVQSKQVEQISVPAGMIHMASDPQGAQGPGIILTNQSGKEESYFFYDNYWNGNGTAGANFDHPLKSFKLGAGATIFVQLDLSFKGPCPARHSTSGYLG